MAEEGVGDLKDEFNDKSEAASDRRVEDKLERTL